MVKTIDKERLYGTVVKREKAIIDFCTGSGTGIILSCLISPDSWRRTAAVCVGLAMIVIGWYRKAKCDKSVIAYLEKQGPDADA